MAALGACERCGHRPSRTVATLSSSLRRPARNRSVPRRIRTRPHNRRVDRSNPPWYCDRLSPTRRRAIDHGHDARARTTRPRRDQHLIRSAATPQPCVQRTGVVELLDYVVEFVGDFALRRSCGWVVGHHFAEDRAEPALVETFRCFGIAPHAGSARRSARQALSLPPPGQVDVFQPVSRFSQTRFVC